MKLLYGVLLAAIISSNVWGQSPSVNASPAAATQPSQPQTAGMPNPGMRPVDITALRIQLNHKLSAEVEEMQFKLNEMRVNAAKAKDPVVKKHLQLETELWQLTLDHFNDMTSAMLQIQKLPNPNAAAQMYRKQMMQREMTGTSPVPVPAAARTQPVPAPAQQSGAVDHP